MPPSISEPPAPSAAPAGRRFLWPADYYSSATPPPVLPRGVSYGCGAASVLVLVIVFVGGWWLSTGGFVQFMDLALGMSLGEMRGMYTPDVTDADKQALEREVEAMRTRMREGAVPATRLQAFLQTLQKSMKDEKMNTSEVRQLTSTAQQAQRGK
jgi:ribosomal protein S16